MISVLFTYEAHPRIFEILISSKEVSCSSTVCYHKKTYDLCRLDCLQAIAIASCLMDEEGSILVVCPAVLRFSWAEELERWLPFCLPSDIHLGIVFFF